jgi:hypothetical protein
MKWTGRFAIVVGVCTSCSEAPKQGHRAAGDGPPPIADNDLGGGDDAPPPADFDGMGFDLAVEEVVGEPTVEPRYFDADSCWLDAGCAGGAGLRTMLAFNVRVRNRGPDALPAESLLRQSPCFKDGRLIPDFLAWRLVDAGGGTAASGTLATACLADEDGPGGGGFTCAAQGLSRGYADVAPRGATCHTADVTNAGGGDFLLEITVNPTGAIPEATLDNNSITVPVTLPAAVCEALDCGGTCCAGPCDGGDCMLPDLTADVPTLEATAWVQEMWFDAEDCAVYEGCVEGTGRRRLLRFATASANIGNADLVLGDPSGNPEMEFSACHNHFHYTGFADYRLLGPGGSVAAVGHKQSFCLVDTVQLSGDNPQQFDCDYQGITVGWADVYADHLDCQWVDVTDVPAGTYDLDVSVNPNGAISEIDYGNNTATISFDIPPDPHACNPGPELCGDGIDGDCDGRPDNGCPPLTGNGSCGNAQPIGAGTLFYALLDGDAPASLCGGDGGAAWFSLALATPEIVYLSTYGSTVDTVLSVRQGCGGPETTCSDDSCGEDGGAWAGQLPAGNYMVTVAAKQAGTSGVARLHVERSGCAGAQRIDGSGTYTGTTSGISKYSSRCTRWGGAGPESLFYFTTCPGDTRTRVTTCGLATFDTEIEIRAGGCDGVVHRGACNDDAWMACAGDADSSQLDVKLPGDGMWMLIVDGERANSAGAFGVTVTLD